MADRNRTYIIDFDKIRSFIGEYKPRRILIQAPDGLKPLIKHILKFLKKLDPGIDVYISGSPCYGACDLAVDEARAIDASAIIHIGHTRYPHLTHVPEIPVLYLPIYYNESIVRRGFIDKLINSLGDVDKIAIVGSIDFIRIVYMIKKMLRDKGYDVPDLHNKYEYMYDHQIIGCDYSILYNTRADLIIVVSSGLFHGIGACLCKPYTRVLIADPLSEKIIDLGRLCTRIMAKRLYFISKLVNEGFKSLAIIIGSKPGQYRPGIVSMLNTMFKEYTVYNIVTEYATRDVVASIDNAFNPDFFVVTSCPRIPIDDLGDYHKPVLTPGEAFMVAEGSLERYRFPW